jgi:hypothetical protein
MDDHPIDVLIEILAWSDCPPNKKPDDERCIVSEDPCVECWREYARDESNKRYIDRMIEGLKIIKQERRKDKRVRLKGQP